MLMYENNLSSGLANSQLLKIVHNKVGSKLLSIITVIRLNTYCITDYFLFCFKALFVYFWDLRELLNRGVD